MSITTNWIFPLGLGILGSIIVFLMNRPKPVPIRIKSRQPRRK